LARSPKNPKVLRRRDRLLNQGCLANARLSQHHDRPAVSVPRPDQQPVQYTALALPTEQHLSSPLLAWAWIADISFNIAAANRHHARDPQRTLKLFQTA
jgi:hypothetical protein